MKRLLAVVATSLLTSSLGGITNTGFASSQTILVSAQTGQYEMVYYPDKGEYFTDMAKSYSPPGQISFTIPNVKGADGLFQYQTLKEDLQPEVCPLYDSKGVRFENGQRVNLIKGETYNASCTWPVWVSLIKVAPVRTPCYDSALQLSAGLDTNRHVLWEGGEKVIFGQKSQIWHIRFPHYGKESSITAPDSKNGVVFGTDQDEPYQVTPSTTVSGRQFTYVCGFNIKKDPLYYIKKAMINYIGGGTENWQWVFQNEKPIWVFRSKNPHKLRGIPIGELYVPQTGIVKFGQSVLTTYAEYSLN